ncbi:Asp23/Gls24 family envelope stress response protein [Planomonospora sp. ID67723]|uniref:Asp23/Gls24 family envelope stress response protein n=1 Tax=Planomonospora sp. ID67723 TaxID=2738134 RepID=UPI0018C38254|nr:Asp23/Gls24 family envelope stress response protein [Planomonospora sp. ID67723]MBG0831244.1 Asp23/Gls24 family envelope stress response protein [Planomonospora sp. ID67723]
MTDVSVEEPLERPTGEITEEAEAPEASGSPAEASATVRPFSLSMSVASAPEPTSSAVVKGRIKVADEVVEKVAALATLEVAGVADMGEDPAHAIDPARERAGARRGPRGVVAHVQDRTVAVDVAIVAEYGHAVMDVANEVKTNVARTVSRMLGMRVVEVNVNVDDVRLPGEPGFEPAGEAGAEL